jgi:hypothetical protein
LVGCDLIGEEEFDPNMPRETARDYLRYANYCLSNTPYKLTTYTTSIVDGEEVTDVSVIHNDGTNYYEHDEETQTTLIYCDGFYYVSSPSIKKKMNISINELYSYIQTEEDVAPLSDVTDYVKDKDLELIANEDGTKILKFMVNIPFFGNTSYEIHFDKNDLVTKQIISAEGSLAGYGFSTYCEGIIEFGEQYKVTPPADADQYEEVSSFLEIAY